MESFFPKEILKLPGVHLELRGLRAYLSQGDNHQIIFLECKQDTALPRHTHRSQWEIVLKGKADVWINEEKKSYKTGDTFYIPKGVPHSAKIYAGYCSIIFFSQKDRYQKKNSHF